MVEATIADLVRCAQILEREAPGDDRACRSAIASVIANRARWNGAVRPLENVLGALIAERGLADALPPIPERLDFGLVDTLALVSGALSGTLADSVHGADYYLEHDREPAMAGLTAVALVGRYCFFRSPAPAPM